MTIASHQTMIFLKIWLFLPVEDGGSDSVSHFPDIIKFFLESAVFQFHFDGLNEFILHEEADIVATITNKDSIW